MRINAVLFHFPGFTGHDHVAEAGEAFLGANFFNLTVDFIVVGEAFNVADDTDSEGEFVAVHHSELLVEEVALAVSVVNEHVIDGVSVFADFNSFEEETVLNETFVFVFTKDHFLTVNEVDCAVGTVFAVGDEVVDTVVPDNAVGEDFNHRCTFVLLSGGKYFLVNLKLDINRAGKEVAAGTKHEFGGDERGLQ